MMEYMILWSAIDRRELMLQVSAAIAQGWEPLGGVCVTSHAGRSFDFFQAMIKKERADNE